MPTADSTTDKAGSRKSSDKTGSRKSMDEFTEVLGRSGEKMFSQANSALLDVTQAGADLFVGAVKIAAEAFEAGADMFTKNMPKSDDSSSMGRTSRIVKAHRETVTEALRVHSEALKQSIDHAHQTVERVAEKHKRTDDDSPAKE